MNDVPIGANEVNYVLWKYGKRNERFGKEWMNGME